MLNLRNIMFGSAATITGGTANVTVSILRAIRKSVAGYDPTKALWAFSGGPGSGGGITIGATIYKSMGGDKGWNKQTENGSITGSMYNQRIQIGNNMYYIINGEGNYKDGATTARYNDIEYQEALAYVMEVSSEEIDRDFKAIQAMCEVIQASYYFKEGEYNDGIGEVDNSYLEKVMKKAAEQLDCGTWIEPQPGPQPGPGPTSVNY